MGESSSTRKCCQPSSHQIRQQAFTLSREFRWNRFAEPRGRKTETRWISQCTRANFHESICNSKYPSADKAGKMEVRVFKFAYDRIAAKHFIFVGYSRYIHRRRQRMIPLNPSFLTLFLRVNRIFVAIFARIIQKGLPCDKRDKVHKDQLFVEPCSLKISARIPILEAFSSAKTRNALVFAPLSRFSQAFPVSLEFENMGKRDSPLSVKFEPDIQDRQSRLFSMTVYESIHRRKQAKKGKRSRLEAESGRLTGHRVAPVFTCPWGQARYHGLKATPALVTLPIP